MSHSKKVKRRGRLSLPYGVFKEDVRKFIEKHKVVGEWLRKYPEKTRKVYAYDLCRYFKWLKIMKGIEFSPRELLNQHLKLSSSMDVAERRKHLSLALEFSRDNPDFKGYSDKRKHLIFSVIRSFYGYHELNLTNNRGIFGRVRRKHKTKQITLSEAKEVMGKLGQRDRTILLIMLQSGMSIGDLLDHFNYMWPQIEPQLDQDIVKIEMPPRKNSDKSYFTFIGRDAIHELKRWLMKREKIMGKPIEGDEPIFVNRESEPLLGNSFVSALNARLKDLGLKEKAFGIRSHQFRKLFKTEASIPDRGIDRDIVEYFLGHTNNNLSAVGGIYDRTPEIHEEVIENEYRKLIPFLEIYSKPEMAQSPKDLGRQNAELMERIAAMEKKTRLLDTLNEIFQMDPDVLRAFTEILKKRMEDG